MGLATGATAAPTLDEAVSALEQAQRRVTDLKAPFRQAAHNKALNQTVDARGTLYLKKPGRLRWEYQTPTPQEIVSDGTRLWIYTPQLKQVNVSAAPAALAGPAGSFLQGLGQVREHFDARFLNPAQPTDADGLVVLDLVPKRPQPLLARLIVSVDPRTLARAAGDRPRRAREHRDRAVRRHGGELGAVRRPVRLRPPAGCRGRPALKREDDGQG